MADAALNAHVRQMCRRPERKRRWPSTHSQRSGSRIRRLPQRVNSANLKRRSRTWTRQSYPDCCGDSKTVRRLRRPTQRGASFKVFLSSSNSVGSATGRRQRHWPTSLNDRSASTCERAIRSGLLGVTDSIWTSNCGTSVSHCRVVSAVALQAPVRVQHKGLVRPAAIEHQMALRSPYVSRCPELSSSMGRRRVAKDVRHHGGDHDNDRSAATAPRATGL